MLKYKLTDCLIFVLLMVLLEALISFARGVFPGEIYTLSIILPVVLIVMMRWGAIGILHAGVGGAVFAVLYGSEWRHIAVYAIGNMFAAVSLLFLFKTGKEPVRLSKLRCTCFVVIGWLGMVLGRSVAAYLTGGGGFVEYAQRFFATDTLNLIVALLVVFIARRQNGVFEDQKLYLIRIAEENKQAAEDGKRIAEEIKVQDKIKENQKNEE